MHLGIDASNLRMGGGVTHLSRILHAGDPLACGIDRVTIWACQSTIDSLPTYSWLEAKSSPWLEAGLLNRLVAQQFKLPNELLESGCDVLFSPGGTLPRKISIPTITMSQNMLPFEPKEVARFGIPSAMWLKMKLLRLSQGRSFENADGLIFLTRYAQQAIQAKLHGCCVNTDLVPHGIEPRFFSEPRSQRSIDDCDSENPFRLLYVSIVMPYKHQISVARAVSQLRKDGFPVEIQFIGAQWGNYGEKFKAELAALDPESKFLKWQGSKPYETLHESYGTTDAFVFASSCENLPNILLEAMGAGLPVASSDCGPMSEVLEDAGVYFDPESPDSIAAILVTLMESTDLRAELATKAYGKAKRYSWEQCAQKTFQFIANTADNKLSK